MASRSVDSDTGSEKSTFCRVCTDFRMWMKHQSKPRSSDNEKSSTASTPVLGTGADDDFRPKRMDCPLHKDELGRSTWAFLHTVGARYPDQPTTQQKSDMTTFIRLFSHIYPCAPCAEELRAKMNTLPPNTESRRELSLWFCEIHNDVNSRLGKKAFDCGTVDERWRDGWKDGSCDN